MNVGSLKGTALWLCASVLTTGIISAGDAFAAQRPTARPNPPVIAPRPSTPSTVQPTAPTLSPVVQVGISPEGSAVRMVLEIIAQAHKSIRMIAYTLTSPDIVNALIKAKQRGVDVQIVADQHVNMSREISRVALRNLVKAGIPLRTSTTYNSLHDKVLIIDSNVIQIGSFNYSNSASHRNSESLVVIRNLPDIANTLEQHWKSRWTQAKLYRPR